MAPRGRRVFTPRLISRNIERERGAAQPELSGAVAHYLNPKQGSMNTAVVRGGIVNVPVLFWNLEVRTRGSADSAWMG